MSEQSEFWNQFLRRPLSSRHPRNCPQVKGLRFWPLEPELETGSCWFLRHLQTISLSLYQDLILFNGTSLFSSHAFFGDSITHSFLRSKIQMFQNFLSYLLLLIFTIHLSESQQYPYHSLNVVLLWNSHARLVHFPWFQSPTRSQDMCKISMSYFSEWSIHGLLSKGLWSPCL